MAPAEVCIPDMALHMLAFCAGFNLSAGICIAMWHLHSKGWFILDSLHNTTCYVIYVYRCQVCIPMHKYAFVRALLLMEVEDSRKGRESEYWPRGCFSASCHTHVHMSHH